MGNESSVFAADPIGEPGRSSGKKNPLNNVYFGEQHLHTSASPDAFVIGVRGTWEDAYNWALGKEITLSTTGEKIKKSTPYDFVAIAQLDEMVVAVDTWKEQGALLLQEIEDLEARLKPPERRPSTKLVYSGP